MRTTSSACLATPALVLSLLACSACGGAAPPPPAGGASTSAAAAAPEEPCLAFAVGARLPTPTAEVGTIVLHATKDSCAFELHASDGTTKPGPACDLQKKRQSLSLAVCALGGDFAWPTNPKQGENAPVIEMKVARYTSPDAKADLELVCTPFGSLKNPESGHPMSPEGLDPSQRSRIRYEILTESLTSRQWRLWLKDLARENGGASTRPQGGALETLRAAAKAAHLACDTEWTGVP